MDLNHVITACVGACVGVCVCVRACMRACMRACVCVFILFHCKGFFRVQRYLGHN